MKKPKKEFLSPFMKPAGLLFFTDFISIDEEQHLVEYLDTHGTWSGLGIPPNPEMKRRTQMFGFEFSYRYRRITSRLGPFPACIQTISDRIQQLILNQQLIPDPYSNGHDVSEMNLLVVNEYHRGQGIMPHVDSKELFGPFIAVVSMLSSCLITFIHDTDAERPPYQLMLPPRSLLLMTGESRSDWKHGIAKDEIERFQGIDIERSRRISLTFRHVDATTASLSPSSDERE